MLSVSDNLYLLRNNYMDREFILAILMGTSYQLFIFMHWLIDIKIGILIFILSHWFFSSPVSRTSKMPTLSSAKWSLTLLYAKEKD